MSDTPDFDVVESYDPTRDAFRHYLFLLCTKELSPRQEFWPDGVLVTAEGERPIKFVLKQHSNVMQSGNRIERTV